MFEFDLQRFDGEASQPLDIKNFIKEVRKAHDVKIAQKYVAKDGDKVLSTNDFSNEYKNKLDRLGSALVYKGTVNSFSDLPANPNIGDVYGITTAGGTDFDGTAIKAGDNVAYNGTGWDVLSGTIDLSNYVVKDGNKVLSTNDYTTEDKTKLSGIESGANNYSLPAANANNLGGIKVGEGLEIDQNGVLSVSVTGSATTFTQSDVNDVFVD